MPVTMAERHIYSHSYNIFRQSYTKESFKYIFNNYNYQI